MTDYWAHHYYDNPNAQDEVVDDDFDLQAELARLEAEAENRQAADPVLDLPGPDDWEDLE